MHTAMPWSRPHVSPLLQLSSLPADLSETAFPGVASPPAPASLSSAVPSPRLSAVSAVVSAVASSGAC